MKDKGKRMERGIRRWIDGINVVRGWEWIWKEEMCGRVWGKKEDGKDRV